MNPSITNAIDEEKITIAGNVYTFIDDYYPISEEAINTLKLVKINFLKSDSILFVLEILTSPNRYGLTKSEVQLKKKLIFKTLISNSLEVIDTVFDCNKEISFQFAKCFHQEVVESLNYIITAIKAKKFELSLLTSHMHISSIAALNYKYTNSTPGTDNICILISKLLALHISSEDYELMSNAEYKKFIARIKFRTLSLNDIAKNNFFR